MPLDRPRRSTRPRVLTILAATAVACLAALASAPSHASGAAARASSGYTWSAGSRSWALTEGVLPRALIARGPAASITRGQFLTALIAVQRLRAADDHSGTATRSLMDVDMAAPALLDAPASSPAARAVAAGWIIAKDGKFASTTPITSDEAALAVLGALGLRTDVIELARRLRAEVPGTTGVRWSYAASQAMVRTLGMRFNILEGNDRYELGPTETMNVAHGSYMLRVAATEADSWKLDEARGLATTFDLPTLGANQRRILGVALRQLGQPYIWAGETEGSQPEGHGGFDCSGFTMRVINGAGIPTDQFRPITQRTSYDQSGVIARARRITRAKLQPGDAIFFGDKGPRSTPAQNFHAGVYMGNGWFIHSSGGNGGVAINTLDGWWGEQFSWGRRVLLTP